MKSNCGFGDLVVTAAGGSHATTSNGTSRTVAASCGFMSHLRGCCNALVSRADADVGADAVGVGHPLDRVIVRIHDEGGHVDHLEIRIAAHRAIASLDDEAVNGDHVG